MKENTKNLFKRSFMVLLCFIMTATLFSGTKPAEAASGDVSIQFIDVTKGDVGRGDATLIDCNGKYVLVDGGSGDKDTYRHLKDYLLTYCKKTSGRIELEAVIASHNHGDHVGGLTKLLNDTSTFKVKTVYRNTVNDNEDFNKECANAKAVVKVGRRFKTQGGTIDKTDKSTSNIHTAIKTIELEGTTISIYPPALDFEMLSFGSNAVNNSSMIVRVDRADGSGAALLLGDLMKTGLKSAIGAYPNLFKNNFTVCKFGHHGLRGGDNDDITTELKLYNENIKTKYYVFTCSQKKLNEKTINKNNYNDIIKGLNGIKVEHKASYIVDYEFSWRNNKFETYASFYIN